MSVMYALQVLTTEYNPEEWSRETEDLMTEPVPEQPGTNVDTKDTSVDKAPSPTTSPPKSPPPSEAKVTSTTSGNKGASDPGQRITPQPARDVHGARGEPKSPASKEPARGGSEGTEMRQRKSPSR